MNADRCILVLGGAGLVGSQIVREIAREMEPARIIVASLYRGEVREFLHDARREFCNVEFIGAWGDVFVRDEFMEENRRRLMQVRARRDALYQDLFGGLEEASARSGLAQLIRQEWEISFHPRYLSAWLRVRGLTPQKPQRVPRERDPERIAAWLTAQWPRIKKRPAAKRRIWP